MDKNGVGANLLRWLMETRKSGPKYPRYFKMHSGPNRQMRRKAAKIERQKQRRQDRKMQHKMGIRVMRYGVGNKKGGF